MSAHGQPYTPGLEEGTTRSTVISCVGPRLNRLARCLAVVRLVLIFTRLVVLLRRLLWLHGRVRRRLLPLVVVILLVVLNLSRLVLIVFVVTIRVRLVWRRIVLSRRILRSRRGRLFVRRLLLLRDRLLSCTPCLRLPAILKRVARRLLVWVLVRCTLLLTWLLLSVFLKLTVMRRRRVRMVLMVLILLT